MQFLAWHFVPINPIAVLARAVGQILAGSYRCLLEMGRTMSLLAVWRYKTFTNRGRSDGLQGAHPFASFWAERALSPETYK